MSMSLYFGYPPQLPNSTEEHDATEDRPSAGAEQLSESYQIPPVEEASWDEGIRGLCTSVGLVKFVAVPG